MRLCGINDLWMMSSPLHSSFPKFKRLIRTVFWTFWLITVTATVYGLCVESFGIGLFLRNDHAPKLHMRGEARLADKLSLFAGTGLLVVTVIISRWSRPLRFLGIAALLFLFFKLSITRL